MHSPSASDPPRWRLVRAVTLVLLAVWFGVTFVTTFFARGLDLRWFGWPLNYWIASQGALIVFVVLIGVYAFVMDRLDSSGAAGAETGPGAG